MIKIHSGLKQIIIYGIGLVSIRLISVVMLPIITHYLSPAEYGTLEVLNMALYLMCIIFNFGISEAIFRFAGSTDYSEIQDQVCGNGTVLNLIIASILFLLILILAPFISALLPGHVITWQIYFLDIALFFNTLWGFQLSCLRIKQDAVSYSIIYVAFSLLFAFFILITLYRGYAVTGIIFASACANFLIYLYIFFFKSVSKAQFNFEWQSKLLHYGLPLILGGIGEFIILWLGNFWLAYVLKISEFAQFALTMKFSIITSLLMVPILTWWYPIRFKQLDTAAGKINCARITESAVILGFLLAFIIALASSVFIKLFISSDYSKAIDYLPWACLVFGFKNAGEVMNTGVFLYNTRYVMWINNVAALFTVLGLYLLVPIFQVWGCIITLNCVYALRWLAFTYYSHKQIVLPYRYASLAFLTITSIGCLSTMLWMNSIFDYFIKGGILCVVILFLTYIRGFIPRIYAS